MKSFKIKVTPKQSKIVQRELFKKGISWRGDDKRISFLDAPYLFFDGTDKEITYEPDSEEDIFNNDTNPEITFAQFKKMVTPKLRKGTLLLKVYLFCKHTQGRVIRGSVIERIDPNHSLSGLRSLRELRIRGIIEYEEDHKKSRYKIVNVKDMEVK